MKRTASKGRPARLWRERDGAICIGTVDGAVWISHLKAKGDPNAHKEACHLAQAGIGCELCDEEFCAIAETSSCLQHRS